LPTFIGGEFLPGAVLVLGRTGRKKGAVDISIVIGEDVYILVSEKCMA
jgi:hypothetical protein